MVMSHRSRAHRGQPPDYFAMMGEDDPARALGWTVRWDRSDTPPAHVEVCRDCDFERGKQCASCAALYAQKRGKESYD